MAALLVGLIVAACAMGPAASPSATPLDQTDAVDLVRAEDPLFAGISPRDPELIGQAAWSEATRDDGGWEVVIRVGWGDCPAGCINEHRWSYAVSDEGEVSLVEETGDPLPGEVGVQGTVLAGPTCPVVTDPPDPSCADRPVPGAELVVTTSDGTEVTRATSDRDGHFVITLAPGGYQLVPQPVDGLMGTAEPMAFSVTWESGPTELVVGYDTGIR
jgi:hypothetical protein